jgi:NAD(P)-dependent dehydrogenase (short-subunit alcohol dehydrogenase family)
VLRHLAGSMRAGAADASSSSPSPRVRVRQADYVYGSAKAGLDGFARGPADALHGSGVRLLLVRPGFVVGRMTAGMPPAPFSSTPGQLAEAVADALQPDREVVCVPGTLRPVFAVLGLLPRAVWRRMPR